MEVPITLVNPRGLHLAGRFLRPEAPERPPAIVFAHGWGSDQWSPRNVAIARRLVAAGMGALLLDLSGHGESEGDPNLTTILHQSDDLRTAVEWLAARTDVGPIGLAGSSTGAAAALVAALHEPRVRALVLRSPSADTALDVAPRVTVPTLVVTGEHDGLRHHAGALASRLGGERRLLVVPRGTHLFDDAAAFHRAAGATVGWFHRWLAEETAYAGGLATTPLAALAVRASAPFRDRVAAGRALAVALAAYRGPDTLVLGLPRGGVPVAAPVAEALGAELDVFVSRKLRAPDEPELAIGALAEGDTVVWNADVLAVLALHPSDWDPEMVRVRRELAAAVAAYRAVRPRAPVAGRTVIVVDDGVATGATLRAALTALQRQGAARLVVAVPGGAPDTLDALARLPRVAAVVALTRPRDFLAVGQLYGHFPQVTTDEVCALLRAVPQPVAAVGGA